MNTVVCPHCKKQVELSEAIIHEFQDKIREEERKSVEAKLGKEHAEKIAEAEKKLRIDLEKETKERAKELEEEGKKRMLELEAAKKKEKELEHKLEQEKIEREKAENRIKEETAKEISEKHRFERLEYEKKINDMQKALEEAQRKGKQGSQQLQGDVLERDLEERLREAFPYDDFRPVPTGIRGGDIVHEVRNKFGQVAGIILWEIKRTKSWDKKWLAKLKEDARKINASDCIIATDVLPPDVKVYDRVENVWVSSYEFCLNLATVVRFGLLNVAIAKKAASHTDDELRELYRVITSDSFRHKFEQRNELIAIMKKELDSEKSSTERRWKRQETYIDKLARNNDQLYGELEAHIPSLKPLSSDRLELENAGDEPLISEEKPQQSLLEE
jgi:hypothetical protein